MSQHSAANFISLLKKSEVDDLIDGNEEKYRAAPVQENNFEGGGHG